MLMVPGKFDKKLAEQALRTMRDEVGGKIKGNKLFPLESYFADLIVPDAPLELNRRTYTAQVAAQQEREVAKALHDEGLDLYLPMEPQSRKVNGVKRTVRNIPMLPGYIFPIFDVHRDHWRAIPAIKGVLRLFMIRERPVPVGEVEIQKVVRREAELNDGGLSRIFAQSVAKVGDCVQIVDHCAFNGFFGLVTVVFADKWRLKVEVDLFGQKVPIDVNADQVRLAG